MRASLHADLAEGVAHPARGSRRRCRTAPAPTPIENSASRQSIAEDRDQDERQADDVAEQADDPRREHLVQRLDVVGQAGHQPPDRRAIEERRRQRQHVAVDAHAQVVHAQLADHLREVELRERRARTGRPAPAGRGSRGDRGRRRRPTAMCSSIAFLSRYGCAISSTATTGSSATATQQPPAVRPDVGEDPAQQRPVERLAEQVLGRRPSPRSACRRSRRGLLRRAARGRATRRGRPTPAAPRACRARRRGRRRAPGSGRRPSPPPPGARSGSTCARPGSAAGASGSSRSVSASTDDSESSRIRICGSAASARASATRWRWPPDSVMPRSPTSVS